MKNKMRWGMLLLALLLSGCGKVPRDLEEMPVTLENPAEAPQDESTESVYDGPTITKWHYQPKEGELKGCYTIVSTNLQIWAESDEEEMPVESGLEKTSALSFHGLYKFPLLKEKEQVVLINVYYLDISSYIEQEVYICDEKGEIRVYYMIVKDGPQRERMAYIEGRIPDYYKDPDKLKEGIKDGFHKWDEELIEAPIVVMNSYAQLRSMHYDGSIENVYLIDEDEFLAGYEGKPLRMENVLLSEEVLKKVEKKIDQQRQRLFDKYDRNANDLIIKEKVIYQDEQYLAIMIEEEEHHDFFILSFDWETGEQMKLEDFIGTGYGAKDMKRLARYGYFRLMQDIPDKYNWEVFNSYYDSPKEFSDMEGSYYFTEDGVVLYYDFRTEGSLPVVYYIGPHFKTDESLEMMVTYAELEYYRSKRYQDMSNVMERLEGATVTDGTYSITLEQCLDELVYDGRDDQGGEIYQYYDNAGREQPGMLITDTIYVGDYGSFGAYARSYEDFLLDVVYFNPFRGDFGLEDEEKIYIYYICLITPRYQTSDGVRVGMTEAELEEIYGDKLKAGKVDTYDNSHWDEVSIGNLIIHSFKIDSEGVIQSITVQPRGAIPSGYPYLDEDDDWP